MQLLYIIFNFFDWQQQERKKLFQGIEEVIDRESKVWKFEDHNWLIRNPNQRMLYVPKDSVVQFMAVVERESQKRINKYRDYAQAVKSKFEDYEEQSEQYYAQMLEKFKAQAREAVRQRQSQIDEINKQQQERVERIGRIKERIQVKAFHGIDSDSDGKEENKKAEINGNIREYTKIKNAFQAELKKLQDFSRKWRDQHQGELPQQDNIPEKQFKQFQIQEKKYTEYRHAMIVQNKLPFEMDQFYNANEKNQKPLAEGERANQMMAALGQGLKKQFTITEHIMKLQSEKEEILDQLAQTDKTGKLGQFIQQLIKKEQLLFERTKKLDDLVRQVGLQAQEKQKLEEKLKDLETEQMMNKANKDANSEIVSKIQNLFLQNEALLRQIESLNAVNSTMIRRIVVLGGKGLKSDQQKELEADTKQSQKRMVDGYEQQADATERTIKQLGIDLSNQEAKKVEVEEGQEQDLEDARMKKHFELEKILAGLMQQSQEKSKKIQTLQEEQIKQKQTFNDEFDKVKYEFEQLKIEAKLNEDKMREKIIKLEKEIRDGAKKAVVQTQTSKEPSSEYKAELDQLKQELDHQMSERLGHLEGLEKRLEQLTSVSATQNIELQTLKERIAEAQKSGLAFQAKIEKFAEDARETKALKEKASLLKQHLREATAELDIVSTKYKEEQVKRKKLLNELEDMKGKVRVYARIRPFSNTEKTNADQVQPCVTILDETSLNVGTQKNRLKNYNFDAVFGPESTQEEVFDDTKRLVQSAIDGYNVVIFAYGQTGSGKTFTIQGSPDKPGLTPRAIVEMFEILKTMTNFDIKLKCYMVELYLNALRDLLLPRGGEVKDLDIKETPTGMIKIENVTEVELTSISQTEQIFEDGLTGRKTRKTLMNDASSRSHLIFSIVVDSQNVNTGVRTVGKLTFVDLAGSEKSTKTGTDAQGQEEANAINLSLSALGNVISALSEGAKFIPYRNHILTKLMKDSLGGTAKTLMFVNCSPSVYNESETKNSLDYATRVKKIKNQVGKNVESKETAKYRDAINTMDSIVEQMKKMLRQSDNAKALTAYEEALNAPQQPLEGEAEHYENEARKKK